MSIWSLGGSRSAAKRSERAEMEGRLAALDRSQAVIEFAMDGTILSANDNFLQAMGYARDEVVGRHHRMFVDDAYAQSAEYRAFWADLNAGRFTSAEYMRRAKGGREVWIQASYNPILDASGAPHRVVKYATDITAAKLRAADDAGQIEAIGRSQAVIAFDMGGIILSANANFLQTMGYEADEVLGKHHRMFDAPGEAAGEAYRRFWERLGEGEYVSAEFKRVGKGGREVWILSRIHSCVPQAVLRFKVGKFASD